MYMGIGKIFSRGPMVDFPNVFLGWGAKSGEIWFLPLETEKTAFLLKFLSPCPPSDTHVCV